MEDDHHPVGRFVRMHKAYLKEEHTGLYQRLILDGNLHTDLADPIERAEAVTDC